MRCGKCDAVVESNTPGGHCPVCLLDALLPGDAVQEAGGLRYELIEEIARGGMGVVYRAIQPGSQREVAVKMILAEQTATPGMMDRFRAEAEAVASLDHPHILPIYEIGESEGRPFYSMKFATGGTLREHGPQFSDEPRVAAQLIATIAHAVHHAHERGILHRDLKPGNILLDGAELTPYVTDFGIAKWLGRDNGLTLFPTALGTPNYVAPEQAAGASASLTTAADIYSLGAIFYELLAGRPPFTADTPLETLRLARETAPTSLRDLVPDVPRDLEVICLKCLAKEPTARYSSAAALAEDLERWLEGRTILARRATAPEQLWRWSKRNPVTATLAIACLTLLLAAGVGSALATVRISSARDRALAAEKDATEKLFGSYLDQARASRLAGRRFDSLGALEKAAAIQRSRAVRDETIAALALVDTRPGASWQRPPSGQLNAAFDQRLERYAVEETLGELSVRRVSDQTEIIRLRGPTTALGIVHEFSVDGRYLAAKFLDGLTWIWELKSGRVLLRLQGRANWTIGDATFSPDGRLLALAMEGGGVAFYRLDQIPEGADPAQVRPWREWNDAPICQDLDFDPTGERLAMTDEAGGLPIREGLFEVRAVESGVRLFQFRQALGYSALDWSMDGRFVAVSSWDHRIYVHDAADGRERYSLRGSLGSVYNLRFSHDGVQLAAASFDNILRLWDVASGTLLCFAPGTDLAPQFSADDRRLGVGFSGGGMGWLEVVRGEILQTLHPAKNLNRPFALSASRDGRFLASAGDNGYQLWDLRSGKSLPLPEAEPEAYSRLSVCFAPDGRTLFASSRTLGLSRWSLAETPDHSFEIGPREGMLLPVDPQCFLGDMSADGQQLAVSYLDKDFVSVVSVNATAPARVDLHGHPNAFQVALSADGRWAASGARLKGGVCVWNLSTGDVTRTLEEGEDALVSFSPDSRWLLTATGRGYQFWRTDNWEPGPRIAPEATATLQSFATAFSPDGNFLAVQQNGDRIALHDAHDGRLLANFQTPRPLRMEYLRFTGDGKKLAALGSNQIIQLWDIAAVRQQLQTRALDWE